MGDEAVAGLTEDAGNEGESFAHETPGIFEKLQGLGYGVGTMVDAFLRGEGLVDEDDPIGGRG